MIVELVGQNWTGAKIIGFKNNPKPCLWEPWNGPNGNSKNSWYVLAGNWQLFNTPLVTTFYNSWSVHDGELEMGIIQHEEAEGANYTQIITNALTFATDKTLIKYHLTTDVYFEAGYGTLVYFWVRDETTGIVIYERIYLSAFDDEVSITIDIKAGTAFRIWILLGLNFWEWQFVPPATAMIDYIDIK